MIAERLDRRLQLCVATAIVAFASSDCFAQVTERSAWLFQMQGEDAAYVKRDDGSWVFARPGKTLNQLDELARTDTEIILQNTRTKLIIRLTSGQSYWRQPNQDDWKTYHRGQWSVPPPSVVDWIVNNSPTQRPTMATETPKHVSELKKIEDASDYRVRVIYFVPRDREPVENWEQKVRVLVYFVDSFYRNDLQAKGLKTKGLAWQEINGQLQVHLARGRRPASYYNDAPTFDKNAQFRRVADDLKSEAFAKPGTLRLVLCETYDPGPSDRLWNGTFALGAYHSARGGLAMFSAHILRDEFCATTIRSQNPTQVHCYSDHRGF